MTSPTVSEPIRNVTRDFEDLVGPAFSDKSYGGVEQFSAFYIAVDADPSENAVFCQMHNRSGKYKDFVTGKMVSYVAIAIPVDINSVSGMSKDKLADVLWELLVKEVEHPSYALPKKFDIRGFLDDLKKLKK